MGDHKDIDLAVVLAAEKDVLAVPGRSGRVVDFGRVGWG